MSVQAADAQAVPAAASPLRLPFETLRRTLLWLTAFSGAFVFIEPSPYEVISLATILVFAVTGGLTLRPALMPLVFLLILYNIGFMIALIPVVGRPKTAQWVAISIYMSVTTIFFAAILASETERRLAFLLKGYTGAAATASLAGIVGYFQLVPHADMFLRYERAQGTFNDPNVFGAFLVLPALLALQRMLAGRMRDIVRGGALLLLLVVGLLLSFSRGAWGQFVLAAVLMLLLTFLTSRSPRERMRIVIVAAAGCLVLALFVIALLSIDQVAELFKERATLEQSYDTGHSGRFGRHVLGFLLALERPFGIGPLQFARIFPEDPHNAYLNAFMSGGWLSGVCYPALIFSTVIIGARYLFVRTPWQRAYLAVFATFVGTVGESFIIDTDHWRHYFMLLGLMWGMGIATRDFAARTPATAAG